MNQAILIGMLVDILEEGNIIKLVLIDEMFKERFEIECHGNMADKSLFKVNALTAVKCRLRNNDGLKLIADKVSFLSS